jgi:hypothetical protein
MTSVRHFDAVRLSVARPQSPMGSEIVTDRLARTRFRTDVATTMIGALSMIAPAFAVPRIIAPRIVAAQNPPPAQAAFFATSSALRPVAGRSIAGTMVGARVTLVARPQDSNHTITAVRFLLDGHTLAEVGPPGQYVWTTSGLRLGRHMVQVQGFSGESFVGISPPLALIVTATDSATVVPVSFPTYGFSARRTSSVPVPRLKSAPVSGMFSETDRVIASNSEPHIKPESGLGAFGAQSSFVIKAYWNGAKQEDAPSSSVPATEKVAPDKELKTAAPLITQQTQQRAAQLPPRNQSGSSIPDVGETGERRVAVASDSDLIGHGPSSAPLLYSQFGLYSLSRVVTTSNRIALPGEPVPTPSPGKQDEQPRRSPREIRLYVSNAFGYDKESAIFDAPKGALLVAKRRIYSLTVSAEHSLGDKTTVSVLVPYIHQTARLTARDNSRSASRTVTGQGIGDIALYLERNFPDIAKATELAVAVGMQFPTGKDSFRPGGDELPTGVGFYQPLARVTLRKIRVPLQLYVTANYATAFSRKVDGEKVTLPDSYSGEIGYYYTLGPEFTTGTSLMLGKESSPFILGPGSNVGYLTQSLTYKSGGSTSLQASVNVGLTEDSTDAYFGFTFLKDF